MSGLAASVGYGFAGSVVDWVRVHSETKIPWRTYSQWQKDGQGMCVCVCVCVSARARARACVRACVRVWGREGGDG